jgi:hypothetical protein
MNAHPRDEIVVRGTVERVDYRVSYDEHASPRRRYLPSESPSG